MAKTCATERSLHLRHMLQDEGNFMNLMKVITLHLQSHSIAHQVDRECKLVAGMWRLPCGLIVYLPCYKTVISKELYHKISD